MGFAVIGAVMLDLTFAKGTRLGPLKPVRRHRRALANVSPVSVPDEPPPGRSGTGCLERGPGGGRAADLWRDDVVTPTRRWHPCCPREGQRFQQGENGPLVPSANSSPAALLVQL
jgi:hypothetical protein